MTNVYLFYKKLYSCNVPRMLKFNKRLLQFTEWWHFLYKKT